MTFVSDPYKAPAVGGGASAPVSAAGLSGALGGTGATTGATSASGLGSSSPFLAGPLPGGAAPAGGQPTTPFGGYFNLPSYNSLYSLWNTSQLGANAAADNQVANLQNKLGLTNAQAGLQQGYLTQDAARQRAQLGLQQQSLADQLGATGKTEADINYNADRQIQNFMGGQAARGATFTPGTERTLGDFQRGRWRGIENLNLDRAQLARTAKSLGMQEDELGIRLSRSLDQLGLSQAVNVQDILSAINDVQAGKFNPLSSLLGQVYALSGVRPVAGQEGPDNGSSTVDTTNQTYSAPSASGGGGSTKRVM